MDAKIFHESLDQLPPAARSRLSQPHASSIFHLGIWFEILAAACASPGLRPWLIATGDGGLVVPLARRLGGAGRHAVSWTNFYSGDFRPLAGSLPPAEQARLLAGILARLRPRLDSLHLHSMAMAGDAPGQIHAALRSAGWWAKVYVQTGNWYEPCAGVGEDAFLGGRSSQLRAMIARGYRRFTAQPGARIEIATTGPALEKALGAYLDVQRRSWKPPEPFAEFLPLFVRMFGPLGVVRVGVATVHERPVAAQIWTVWQRRATIAKLVHDDAARHLSPGTMLTAWMIGRALEAGEVDEIDFGPGDQTYKRLWFRRRRPVLGLIAGNPRSVRGAAIGLRCLAGAIFRRLTRSGDAARAA